MDLVVDGNKYALVKSGEAPYHEILMAESELRVQYADAIGDNEYRLYCGMINDITRQEITLAQIQGLTSALRDAYVPLFAENLNRLLRTKFVFDVSRPDEYDANLQRALNRSKGLKLEIDLKRQRVEKIAEKYENGSGGKVTREYFMGILIELSDSAHFPLTETITVWEFCERIKKHNKKAELINKTAKHG